jgi:hypothetical protein
MGFRFKTAVFMVLLLSLSFPLSAATVYYDADGNPISPDNRGRKIQVQPGKEADTRMKDDEPDTVRQPPAPEPEQDEEDGKDMKEEKKRAPKSAELWSSAC